MRAWSQELLRDRRRAQTVENPLESNLRTQLMGALWKLATVIVIPMLGLTGAYMVCLLRGNLSCLH